MRYTAEKTAEHHRHILDEAARQFRERGFSGVSLGEIMRATGLTHGPFYNHFASKQDLMAQSVVHAFASTFEGLDRFPQTADGRSGYLDDYLSTAHRDAPGDGCVMAALAIEIGREPKARRNFTDQVSELIGRMAAHFPWPRKRSARSDAIRTVASMVGAMVLARAVDDDALASEILREVRDGLA